VRHDRGVHAYAFGLRTNCWTALDSIFAKWFFTHFNFMTPKCFIGDRWNIFNAPRMIINLSHLAGNIRYNRKLSDFSIKICLRLYFMTHTNIYLCILHVCSDKYYMKNKCLFRIYLTTKYENVLFSRCRDTYISTNHLFLQIWNKILEINNLKEREEKVKKKKGIVQSAK